MNSAAERAVLAGICQYGDSVYYDVCDLLDTDTFEIDSNQIIYKCIQPLFSETVEKVDLASILSSAQSLGLSHFFTQREEINHLKAILNFPIDINNVSRMAAKIRKLRIAKLYQEQLGEINRNLDEVTGDESALSILGMVEDPIFNLSSLLHGVNRDVIHISEGLREYIQNILENPVDMVGIPTGYNRYDYAIGGGLRNGSVNLIAARPAIGKTSLAVNIIINIASKLQIPVYYGDTEMGREDQWVKLIACLSGVALRKVETGYLTLEEKKLVLAAIGKAEEIPYFYECIEGQPFENTLSSIRRWVRKHVGIEAGKAKPCVIVIDYIKLMSEGQLHNLTEFQRLGFMMTTLHNFTLRMECPCLAFTQLNRDGITKVETDVIAGSDRLVWLASSLSLFRKIEDVDKAEFRKFPYNRQMIPIKTRHGKGLDDGDYIAFDFHRDKCLIEEGLLYSEMRQEQEEFNPKIENLADEHQKSK